MLPCALYVVNYLTFFIGVGAWLSGGQYLVDYPLASFMLKWQIFGFLFSALIEKFYLQSMGYLFNLVAEREGSDMRFPYERFQILSLAFVF